MGADHSRVLSPEEEEESPYSHSIFTTPNDRKEPTSTTIDVGFAIKANGLPKNGHLDILHSMENDSETNSSLILTGEHITMEEFNNAIVHSQNGEDFLSVLQNKFTLHPQFLFQVLNRAIVTKRVDILVHALQIHTILPSDSPLQISNDQLMHLLQKVVTLATSDGEAMEVLLSHIKQPLSSKMKMELQSLAIMAAQFGQFFAVRQLCLKYAICLEQNYQGKSVLLELARVSNDSLESYLSELLKMGVYVNTQDPDGNTALHVAAQRGLKDVAKLLLSYGACINLPNAQGKKVTDFWESWDDPELSNLIRETPEPHKASLYLAAEQHDTKPVQKLLSQGVLVNSKWIHGRTALCAAARAGNRYMVEYLLEAGAKPIPTGSYWPELPIVHALIGKSDPDIAMQLMEKTEESINDASDLEREHIAAQLVSLLHFCAQQGFTDIARSILQSKCRINPNTQFIDGLAPIHMACKHNQISIVKLLIAFKCRSTLPSEVYGNTPLHYACFYGNLDIARLLLSHRDVLINCINYQHETPLYCVLKAQLKPHEKNNRVREDSTIFLTLHGGKLCKPGRYNCELREFNLDMAAQRWSFVPQQTQKLLIVLRNEGNGFSLASECRRVIRAGLQVAPSDEVVHQLGLPFRLQNYVLFRDWFP